jgi:NADH-quinone oxidoreductase subunit M
MRMPFIAVGFVVAGLASLGLPGLSGFVSEFLVFIGSFPVRQTATMIAVATIALTAGYMLWLLQRVFFGPERTEWRELGDASHREVATVSILVATIAAVGVFPWLIGTTIITGILPIAARYAT